MLPPRVPDYQAVLCPAILPYVPAANADVSVISPNLCDVKKNDATLSAVLSEKKKQVTAHKNVTHIASVNVCVRYFDNGQEKQERDDSSKQKALNDDKRMKADLQKQAKSASAQKWKKSRTSSLSTSTKELCQPRDKLE